MDVKVVVAILGFATVVAQIYLEKEKGKNLEKHPSYARNSNKSEILEVIPI
ncbi:hypothetical protein K8354_13150 [Polaribacter litorisediminis]|uniref:hypothetical protein n=1 Tax=Polaribacter litorisediminis TaxID=1908341 RepID=UPI001CBCC503|nr:hypothetical protein [Polaribacter litorisediminis]UAM97260.1 hypothetical protein K8354_13150 [Polaribacter litorisediminis]